MKNHWVLGGVVVVAVVAGATIAHVSGSWPAQRYIAANSSTKSNALTARQQMARMIAETAARSAAQAAKAVIVGKVIDPATQTASAAASAEADFVRSSR